MNLTIRVRLTLWYAGLLAAIITCLSTFLILQLRSDLRLAIDEETHATSGSILAALATERREHLGQEPGGTTEDAQDFEDAARASLPPSGVAQILDAEGRVMAHYGSATGDDPLVTAEELRAALAGQSPTRSLTLGGQGQRYRAKATAFTDQSQSRILVVAVSLKPVQGPVREVLLLLLIAGPTALVATSVAAYWLARTALRPVQRLTSDAREIGSGGLHERVAVSDSRDEIGRLGLTLNAMLDRIERGVTDKHRLVADASHALRTPLAVMRAEIDVSLRGDELPPAARDVLESAREEVDRMSRTVDNLLTLAEADEGRLELLTVPVSLRQAIDDSARPLRLLAAAKDVSLLAEGAPIEAQADPQRLHLAVTNLIENAIKFSPPGGRVRVTSWSRGSEVGITVSDEGPGIPPEDRGHLFDRYYRVDSARGRNVAGSGLGLAISHEVALSHGGRLWLESTVGGGSTFFLALPSWRAIRAADNESTPADDPGSHLAPNA
ncbi:MAG: ATP-binding protein [Actinomycetota bacterium]|nr:ATP-binding protein [Actinomycetota bacterium]